MPSRGLWDKSVSLGHECCKYRTVHTIYKIILGWQPHQLVKFSECFIEWSIFMIGVQIRPNIQTSKNYNQHEAGALYMTVSKWGLWVEPDDCCAWPWFSIGNSLNRLHLFKVVGVAWSLLLSSQCSPHSLLLHLVCMGWLSSCTVLSHIYNVLCLGRLLSLAQM